MLLMTMKASLAAGPDIETVFVKGGCYQMGNTFDEGKPDEKPVHQVCVNDFYIGKYLVTQTQWTAVMSNNPSAFTGDRRPVDSVSWDDAQAFIAKLNSMTGKRYRLPTDAEWEYAARSGGKQEKWAGTNDPNQLGEYAWYFDNSEKKRMRLGHGSRTTWAFTICQATSGSGVKTDTELNIIKSLPGTIHKDQ